MRMIRRCLLLFWLSLPLTLRVDAADVLTYRNDNGRTGATLDEAGLGPSTVTGSQLVDLFNLPVDGQVYAQPLYVAGIPINDIRHNLLIVCTENDSVYAFDADKFGGPLWHTSFVNASEKVADSLGCDDLAPSNGITATPVVDREITRNAPNGRVFVLAMTQDRKTNQYIERLHILDLTTGLELQSHRIAANAAGTFPPADVIGGRVNWNPAYERGRAGLLLRNGVLYTAWGSICDFEDPVHGNGYAGWVIAYSEASLNQIGVLNTNPTGLPKSSNWNSFGSGGGIWGSGGGLSADTNNVFTATGNGPFDGGSKSFGDSVLKLQATNCAIVDFVTDPDQATMQAHDLDLGSGTVVVLPDLTDAGGISRKLGVIAGKEGKIVLFDRTNLGKATGSIYQSVLPAGGDLGGIFGGAAYFNSALYFGPNGQQLSKWVLSGAKMSTSPVAKTSTRFSIFPGCIPSISALSSSNGIVWAIQRLTNRAMLHAYDASNLQELFNSGTAIPGSGIKFSVPTVCNSKVFVGTDGNVSAFGPSAAAAGANRATDVTSSIQFSAGAFVYNPLTGHFWQPVLLKNTGTASLNPPLSLVLPNLGSIAVLWNNSGATTLPVISGGPIADPYVNAPLTGPLAPGQSVTFHIVFIDAADQASRVSHIVYGSPVGTPRVYAGIGYR